MQNVDKVTARLEIVDIEIETRPHSIVAKNELMVKLELPSI